MAHRAFRASPCGIAFVAIGWRGRSSGSSVIVSNADNHTLDGGAAGLAPVRGNPVDDITCSRVDHMSIYTHPLCPDTWRNGQRVGDKPIAAGY